MSTPLTVTSTQPSPTPSPVTNPLLPPAVPVGTETWLCTFTVQVDLPTVMDINTMESAIAGAIAPAMLQLGLPGNVSVVLTATAGNRTVLSPEAQVVKTPALVVEPTLGPITTPGATPV